MTYKFLIDECLSPELVKLAVDAGHIESTCVRDRGWLGAEDWRLAAFAVAGDYTLVTHNAVDFRGGGIAKQSGYYAALVIHAGLVCLNSVHTMTLNRQRMLFQHVLVHLTRRTDLINTAFDVFEAEDGKIDINVYDIPKPDP